MKKTITIIVSLVIGGLLAITGEIFLRKQRLNLTPTEIRSISASYNLGISDGGKQTIKSIYYHFTTKNELKLNDLILIKKPEIKKDEPKK